MELRLSEILYDISDVGEAIVGGPGGGSSATTATCCIGVVLSDWIVQCWGPHRIACKSWHLRGT
jgi:hypothetical protein